MNSAEASKPALARTEADLSRLRGGLLVPTMGALHAGHAALIDLARREAVAGGGAPVIVSVFVNPTQFNERTDFERYPRSLEEDLRKAGEAGADVVFAPPVEVVYPGGEATSDAPLPSVATEPGLEDRHRPGHFAGVQQVVARLFELTRPRGAVFGEKDWQQLQLVRRMEATRALGVRIVSGPTVREPDGLALSSRNLLLDGESRVRGGAIPRALREAGAAATPGEAERAMRERLASASVEAEYAVVRDAETLTPLAANAPPKRPARALIAARVGGVRLIDNAPWGSGEAVV